MKLVEVFVIFASSILYSSEGLNVLFVPPCYGGRFVTMASLFGPVCKTHNCTIVETAKLCASKLKPYREKLSFQVIEKHGMPEEITLKGNLEFMLTLGANQIEWMNFIYQALSEILEDNPHFFDLILADQVFPGTMIAAEKFDIPVVVQTPGVPAGVENLPGKLHMTIADLMLKKFLYKSFRDHLGKMRAQNGLTRLSDHGGFLMFEYASHFPLIIPTSPSFYPKPDKSVEHIYIGALRSKNYLPKLDKELENSINNSNKDVVYLSLGTHSTMDKETFSKLVENFSKSNDYRIIFSLSTGLGKLATEIGASANFSQNILLTGYISQFALLGHPKVTIFITHCGLGAVIDILKQKKPAVFVPQLFDQFQNALQLEKLNAGVRATELSFGILDTAIQKVRSNYEVHVNEIEKLSREFSEYEKEDLILHFLEEVASRKRTTIQYDLSFQLTGSKYHYAWNCFVCLSYFLVTLFLFLIVKSVYEWIKKKNSDKEKLN